MTQNTDTLWSDDINEQLSAVLADMSNKGDVQNFLRDVMTEKEIIEIGARLEAARLLTIGFKYADVTEKTKLSSRTVARISKWLKSGSNGYQTALQIIDTHHTHIPPARAE
jgi:TrpR-related protein YerC/YecD